MSNELTLFQEFNTQEPTVKYILQLKCYQGLSLETIEQLEEYVSDAKHIVTKASFDLAGTRPNTKQDLVEIFPQGEQDRGKTRDKVAERIG